MRYFHYLSVAKVNMFYEQLAGRSWNPSVEGGFRLMGIGGSAAATRVGEPTPYQKLGKIEEALSRMDPPGSLDDPQPWIRDRLMLRSVVLNVQVQHEKDSSALSDTVLFVGKSRSGVSVVLGGSAAHLQPGLGAATGLNSTFYYLQHTVWHAAAEWSSIDPEDDGGGLLFRDPEEDDDGEVTGGVQPDGWLSDCVRHIVDLAESGDPRFQPMGYCELLARTISATPADPRSAPGFIDAVLATPLYVAQMEISEPADPWV